MGLKPTKITVSSSFWWAETSNYRNRHNRLQSTHTSLYYATYIMNKIAHKLGVYTAQKLKGYFEPYFLVHEQLLNDCCSYPLSTGHYIFVIRKYEPYMETAQKLTYKLCVILQINWRMSSFHWNSNSWPIPQSVRKINKNICHT